MNLGKMSGTGHVVYCRLQILKNVIYQRPCGNNIRSFKRQEVGTDGQGFHKWQAMVNETGNGNLW
jgi:hypothetical protein